MRYIFSILVFLCGLSFGSPTFSIDWLEDGGEVLSARPCRFFQDQGYCQLVQKEGRQFIAIRENPREDVNVIYEIIDTTQEYVLESNVREVWRLPNT